MTTRPQKQPEGLLPLPFYCQEARESAPAPGSQMSSPMIYAGKITALLPLDTQQARTERLQCILQRLEEKPP